MDDVTITDTSINHLKKMFMRSYPPQQWEAIRRDGSLPTSLRKRVREFLRTIPWFKELSEEDRARLIAAVEMRIRQNWEGKKAFERRMKKRREERDGRKAELARQGSFDF